jgi:hypothetical protein
MKKSLVLLIIMLLVLPLFLAAGCGRDDVSQAQELKQAGDEIAAQAYEDLKEIDSPEYNMRQSYMQTIATGQPQGNGDMDAIDAGYAGVLSEIEEAAAKYNEIHSLRGVEEYKAYATWMLAFLDTQSAWIEASIFMDEAMDPVQKPGENDVDTAAAALEIDIQREKVIAYREEASQLFNSAYQLDKEKLHEGDPAAEAAPEHVHLSWEKDPATSITIHWETELWLPGYVPTVEIGEQAEDLSLSDKGQSLRTYFSDYEQHEVECACLMPETTYYYRCGSPGYGWSEVFSFRTPPQETGEYTFCVVGDTRSATPDSTDVSEWEKVAAAAATESPLFTLLLGDEVFLGFQEEYWPPCLDATAPLFQKGCIMASHGNHEEYAMEYFDRFSFPDNERWYSFDVGSVHFVCLDTGLMDYSERPLLGEQSPWLEEDLQQAEEKGMEWTVVFFHRPPYSSGEGYGEQPDIIAEWVPIFERYGVDLVLASHEHFYQRSLPMLEGQALTTTGDMYKNTGGTVYVIQGCGGAPMSDPLPAAWMASMAKEFSYTLVRVFPGQETMLEVVTKSVNGEVLDSFSLAK